MNIYAPLFSLCLLVTSSSNAMENQTPQTPSPDEVKKMRAQTHHRTDLNPTPQPNPQRAQPAQQADDQEIHWLDLSLLRCLNACCSWFS